MYYNNTTNRPYKLMLSQVQAAVINLPAIKHFSQPVKDAKYEWKFVCSKSNDKTISSIFLSSTPLKHYLFPCG